MTTVMQHSSGTTGRLRNSLCGALAAGALFLSTSADAALTLEPLASFGNNGWLQPGTGLPGLTTDNSTRGMAYNVLTNEVLVPSRSGPHGIHVYDGTTGAFKHTIPMTTTQGVGVSGTETFPINMISVAADGALYVGNLTTTNAHTFRVYRLPNSSAAATPTLVYSAVAPGGLGRIGDTLSVIGSGANTRIAASGGGHNSVVILDTTDGVNFTVSSTDAITGVAAGGFRLGLDWIDETTVIGNQTGGVAPNFVLNVGDLTTNTGTVHNINSGGEGPLAYYAPQQLLATVDVFNSQVRLYDASNLALLTSTGFQDMARLFPTESHVANGNGVGDLAFGMHNGVLRLYAMNTNNGIQAFEVIPEPSTVAAILGFSVLGLALVVRRRRRA